MAKRVVFLYTEVADYFLKCVDSFVRECDAQVLIVRWPIRSEAPFEISTEPKVNIIEKENYSFTRLEQLVSDFQPDLIYAAGWRDKDYLKIIKKYYSKIPTVLGCDNIWTGSFRQIMASLISPVYLKRIFSDIWIPGQIQLSFAKKLGYSEAHTHLGFYCCNYPYFSSVYSKTKDSKQISFPKRLIFCARYVKWKGIFELWQAYKELQEEEPNEWELWCLGTGEEYQKKIEYPGIKHFGFIQPGQMEPYLAQTGVYILPSSFEPWGVSVHEFASAGFPLILTKQVGAASQFLKEGLNGFVLEELSVAQIKESLQRLFSLNDDELTRMSEASHIRSSSITHKTWADTLMGLLNRR